MLGFNVGRALLEAQGLKVLGPGLAESPEAAARAANALFNEAGGARKVALKLISPDLSHKSDRGLVRLGLESPNAVLEAARAMAESLAPGAPVEGFLVQPMLEAARELFVGGFMDPQFGPMVAFGPGGILVELLGGVDFLRPPFSDADARLFVARNAAQPLLVAARGRAGVKEGDLVSLLQAVGRLMLSGDLASLDLNPVMAGPDGSLNLVDFRLEGRKEQ